MQQGWHARALKSVGGVHFVLCDFFLCAVWLGSAVARRDTGRALTGICFGKHWLWRRNAGKGCTAETWSWAARLKIYQARNL